MEEIICEIFQFVESLKSFHAEKIFEDCNKQTNIPKKIFCNALEIENGLYMFFWGINFQAFSQSLIILRQLSEQVCFLNVVSKHKECYDIINEHSKLKLDCLKYDNIDDLEVKNKFKDSKCKAKKLHEEAKKRFPNIKKLVLNDYLEYGWMLEFTDKCGVEKLYEISDFEVFKKWRKISNSVVHNTISFYQNPSKYQQGLIIESLNVVFALLELYMCSYENITASDFIHNNIDYREKLHFINAKFIVTKKILNYENMLHDK